MTGNCRQDQPDLRNRTFLERAPREAAAAKKHKPPKTLAEISPKVRRFGVFEYITDFQFVKVRPGNAPQSNTRSIQVNLRGLSCSDTMVYAAHVRNAVKRNSAQGNTASAFGCRDPNAFIGATSSGGEGRRAVLTYFMFNPQKTTTLKNSNKGPRRTISSIGITSGGSQQQAIAKPLQG